MNRCTDLKVNVGNGWKKIDFPSWTIRFCGQRPPGLDKRTLAPPREDALKTMVDLAFRNSSIRAVIIETPETVCLSVDHVRSVPIYYRMTSGALEVWDHSAFVSLGWGGWGEHHSESAAELQLAGYVTADRTLFRSIRQVEAGHAIIFRRSGQATRPDILSHFDFSYQTDASLTAEDVNDRLREVSQLIVSDLTRDLAGRQAVIPLSGGYDSRLIATLLVQAGYSNILTFTYGIEGNPESTMSARVAGGLNIEWIFCRYTPERWRDYWNSEERQRSFWSVGGPSSIPHIQDYLVVKDLKSQGIIENSAAFIPGHTGDFISGGHLPKEAFRTKDYSADEVADIVFRRHFLLANASLFGINEARCREILKEQIPSKPRFSPQELAQAAEAWECRERQAKFICNSVRAYESFGYDWFMPLWDRRFVEFWLTVPLKLRRGSISYRRFVDETYSSVTGDRTVLGNAGKPTVGHFLNRAGLTRNARLWRAIKSFAKRFDLESPHPMGFDFLRDYIEPPSLEGAHTPLNGLLARRYIDQLSK